MARDRLAVYWDSCVFLAIINNEPGRVDQCVALFKESSEKRKSQILTSAMTIAECADAQGASESAEKIRLFFENPCVTVIGVDRLIAERAASLQRQVLKDFGRKLDVRDSIHLATALLARASILLTYDGDDLIRLNGCFQTADGISLSITEPFWQGPAKLL